MLVPNPLLLPKFHLFGSGVLVVKIRYFNKYGEFKSTPSEFVTTNEMIVGIGFVGEHVFLVLCAKWKC